MLNDNGRCYAPTVSRLTAAGDDPGDADGVLHGRSASTYVGPVDGHDIAALEDRAARRGREPTARSSCTCSRARARGTDRRRPTRRSACTTSAPSTPRPACRRPSSASSYTGAFASRAGAARRERHPELVAITAGMPGSTGLLPFADTVPRPLPRRRDRRAARGHRGRGHGDARPAPGRRGLLHVPQPGVGPAPLRRGAARPAGRSSASTAPASPATTAPATTASTTSRCSPRCRA